MTPIDLLITRRTVPAAFLGPPGPDDAQLALILKAAARVPDHGKLGPWRFIVYAGEARAEINRALLAMRLGRDPGLPPEEVQKDQTRFTQAPLVIGLVSRAAPHEKIPEWEQVLSAGAVGMNILNAAAAIGLGANWLTGWPAYDAEAGAYLGLKPGERFAGFLHIGTPTVPPQERWRPDSADLVSYWHPPAGGD